MAQFSAGRSAPRPQIAVDYNSTVGKFFVNHTVHSTRGTRVAVDFAQLGCSNGNPIISGSSLHHKTDPDPCDPSPLGGCQTSGPDGGVYIQDEWGQSLSFNYNGSTPRLVETWYGTRDDVNNIKAGLYMMYSEDEGVTWSTPAAISIQGTGQTVPWDYHLGDWSDYQSTAPNTLNGGFLGAWGGDCRQSDGSCHIFGTTMQ